MRTAFISDIHGNYPALMKVLEDARAEHVDNFIFLGDYYMDFPYSNEVVQELIGMDNTHLIKGNKEEYMQLNRDRALKETIREKSINAYQAIRELTQESYDFLNSLEDELYIRLSPKALVYATHVSPIYERPPGGPPKNKHCNNHFFYQAMLEKPFSHEEFLDDYHNFVNSDICIPYIQNIDANIIVYGHNHLQSYAYCGEKLVINPGSCGLPFDFNNKAPYTILEETRNGFNVIERRVAYDIDAVINYTRSSVLYEKNRIICELTFLDMRCGRNHLPILVGIAREIAATNNEEGEWLNYSNATWEEAGGRFFAQYGETYLKQLPKN